MNDKLKNRRRLEIIQKRQEFRIKFCASKGWSHDPKDLTEEQLTEIHNHPDWISIDPDNLI